MSNQSQDVRVKLTAEGIAEVVQAFSQVSSAAKKSGKESADAFKDLSKQFGELGKNLAGGLSIAYGVEQLTEFFNATLETAEGLERLSQQTGLSTATIQGFGRAARETGLGADVANAALAKFTSATGKAEIGSKQSADAFADLGLKARDLSSMSPDMRLAAVAAALAQVPDPARRARDEMALFGRSGVELDAALVKMGKEGLDPFIDKLKSLGVFLSGEEIADLVALKDHMRDLSDETKGLANQFLAGLVPALDRAAQSLIQATSGEGANGFKELGKIVGDVFNGIILSVTTIGKSIGAMLASAVTAAQTAGQLIRDGLSGNFKAITADFKSGVDQQAAIFHQLGADIGQTYGALFNEQKKPQEQPTQPGAGLPGGNTSQAAALARAKYQLLVTQLDNEQKLFETNSKLEQDINESNYKQGITSLQDYYTKRAQIIDAEFQKRIDIAKQKASAEAALPVADSDVGTAAVQKQQQQAKLQGEIADLQAQRSQALAQNNQLETQAATDLANKQLATQVKLLELEGKKTEAARLRLQLDSQALSLELRQAGASDSDRTTAVGNFQAQGSATIGFQGAQKDANSSLSSLNTQIKSINDSVASGQTFSIAAQQQIIALEQQNLPMLQQQAAAMEKFAHDSNDPTLIAQADAFNEKIKEIGTNINVAGQQMAQFKQGVESAVGAGLNTFLKDATSGTKNLGQTFRDAALSILNGLEQIAEKLIEQEVLKEIFGSSSSIVSIIGGAAATGAASGGLIKGPGTSTSDSIPARLSDGEYVVNAKATASPGVRPILEAINAGTIRGPGTPGVVRFATGGAVTAAAAGGGHKIINVLDPTLLGDHLATEPGERSVLNIISRNPTKVRNSIG